MPAWTRMTITAGDRVTVEIPYSDRAVLRPLIGKLRCVEVTADRRALIYDGDANRYRFDGRTVPPVALVEASIFTDSATGQLWANTYKVPPRDPSPYPLPPECAAVAEADGQGGIARMPSCRCGRGCACPGCGEQTISVARGLDWADMLTSGEAHNTDLWCRRSSCQPTEPFDLPYCCAWPMMLAPVGWVCRRDCAHRRPYRWPNPADRTVAVDREAGRA